MLAACIESYHFLGVHMTVGMVDYDIWSMSKPVLMWL